MKGNLRTWTLSKSWALYFYKFVMNRLGCWILLNFISRPSVCRNVYWPFDIVVNCTKKISKYFHYKQFVHNHEIKQLPSNFIPPIGYLDFFRIFRWNNFIWQTNVFTFEFNINVYWLPINKSWRISGTLSLSTFEIVFLGVHLMIYN